MVEVVVVVVVVDVVVVVVVVVVVQWWWLSWQCGSGCSDNKSFNCRNLM